MMTMMMMRMMGMVFLKRASVRLSEARSAFFIHSMTNLVWCCAKTTITYVLNAACSSTVRVWMLGSIIRLLPEGIAISIYVTGPMGPSGIYRGHQRMLYFITHSVWTAPRSDQGKTQQVGNPALSRILHNFQQHCA